MNNLSTEQIERIRKLLGADNAQTLKNNKMKGFLDILKQAEEIKSIKRSD